MVPFTQMNGPWWWQGVCVFVCVCVRYMFLACTCRLNSPNVQNRNCETHTTKHQLFYQWICCTLCSFFVSLFCDLHIFNNSLHVVMYFFFYDAFMCRSAHHKGMLSSNISSNEVRFTIRCCSQMACWPRKGCLNGPMLWVHAFNRRMLSEDCFLKKKFWNGGCSHKDHLVGLVVKASALRAANLGSIHACTVDLFSSLNHTSDLKTGTPVATLPGSWNYRVSAGTGWPGVSILWLSETESLTCNFCLSLVVCTLVWADLSHR